MLFAGERLRGKLGVELVHLVADALVQFDGRTHTVQDKLGFG